MKRIITTSAAFSGEVYIVYGENNMLLLIDFMNAVLSPEQINFLKQFTPVFYNDQFPEAFGKARLEFVIEGYEVTFDMFWRKYDEKLNRDRCLKRWDRMPKADRAKAYAGITPYFRHLQKNTWKNKANPDTYLRDKYWENEWK